MTCYFGLDLTAVVILLTGVDVWEEVAGGALTLVRPSSKPFAWREHTLQQHKIDNNLLMHVLIGFRLSLTTNYPVPWRPASE